MACCIAAPTPTVPSLLHSNNPHQKKKKRSLNLINYYPSADGSRCRFFNTFGVSPYFFLSSFFSLATTTTILLPFLFAYVILARACFIRNKLASGTRRRHSLASPVCMYINSVVAVVPAPLYYRSRHHPLVFFCYALSVCVCVCTETNKKRSKSRRKEEKVSPLGNLWLWRFTVVLLYAQPISSLLSPLLSGV